MAPFKNCKYIFLPITDNVYYLTKDSPFRIISFYTYFSTAEGWDLLLAVCMLVQEMADMLFHLGLTFGSPCTERSLVMGPLVLLIS